MNENQSLIIRDASPLPVVKIAPVALQMRDEALAASALIGKVETADHNNKCSAARRTIKGLLSLLESERKKNTDPLLELQRQIKRDVDTLKLDLEKEDARLENLEKDFIRAELRRRQEEEEAQRRELVRIEAEKQAELARIAREAEAAKAEAERIIQEQFEREQVAREAAARLATEATNKRQREEAATALAEVNRQAEVNRVEQERIATINAEIARQQSQLVTERAEAAAYVESKPVEISKARGQSVRKEWIIEQINDFQLIKARPDLVRKIEWDMVALKQALASGEKLPGVRAREDIAIGARPSKALIEV